jgi:hypothetical protein
MPSSGHAGTFTVSNLPVLRNEKRLYQDIVAREDPFGAAGYTAEIRHGNTSVPVYLSPIDGQIRLDELARFYVETSAGVTLVAVH